MEPKEYERMWQTKKAIKATGIWCIYLLTVVDTLLLKTSLHFTSPNYTSFHFTTLVDTSLTHLNFTQLHFTILSFGLTPFKFSTASFHLTSLTYTFVRSISPPFVIAFLTLFLKIPGLQGKVSNASADSWFQFLMVLFTKEYFLIPVLCFLSLIFRTRSALLK